MTRPEQQIAIAVVRQGDWFLVGRRPEGVPLAGMAEFPGGKVQPGESLEAAARRECLEETGLEVAPVGILDQLRHEYPHAIVHLTFWECRVAAPDVEPQHGYRWVRRAELAALEFPPANRDLVERLVAGRLCRDSQ